MSIEEVEERLAKARESRRKAEDAQAERDLEARIALEEEHGNIAGVRVLYRQGYPTRAFVKTPSSSIYRRYLDQIGKSAQAKDPKRGREASELMAKSCWVYPADEKDRDSMLEAFPGLLTSIALAAAALAEGKAEDEGKG